jgi:hypothetical protein
MYGLNSLLIYDTEQQWHSIKIYSYVFYYFTYISPRKLWPKLIYKIDPSGLEMLAEQAAKRRTDCEATSSTSGPRFDRFVAKLTDTGYFKGELPGSKKYTSLLEQARQFYSASVDADSDDGGGQEVRFSSEVLELSRNCRLAAPEDDEDPGDSLASDDESWLDVEPESFDALLRQHFKLESEKTEFGADAAKSDSELPAEIKRFLQSLSEFDGIQVT